MRPRDEAKNRSSDDGASAIMAMAISSDLGQVAILGWSDASMSEGSSRASSLAPSQSESGPGLARHASSEESNGSSWLLFGRLEIDKATVVPNDRGVGRLDPRREGEWSRKLFSKRIFLPSVALSPRSHPTLLHPLTT